MDTTTVLNIYEKHTDAVTEVNNSFIVLALKSCNQIVIYLVRKEKGKHTLQKHCLDCFNIVSK